ncbi:MAG: glucose-6-phosphate isomerase [Balneolales bacterium]
MFTIDASKARLFLTDQEWTDAWDSVSVASRELDNRTGMGTEWLGWQEILQKPDTVLLDNLREIGSTVYSEADVFIICGIGGSYLGARAVIEALSPDFREDGPEILYAGHHISGRYLKQLIRYLEKPKSDGSKKSVYLNVISKSGTTIETALAFRILRKWMHERYGDKAVSRIFCTTSKEGGALNQFVRAFGYRQFILPDDIGGRFSVLTPVGLFPVAVAGIPVKQIYSGAVQAYENLKKNRENLLEYTASRLALYRKGYAIDLVSTFEPHLVSLGGWLQQLYGESEGKNGQGLFPSVLQYTTDLHSLGQMVQDGRRNLIETFLTVRNQPGSIIVEEDTENYDGLNYLTGKSLEEINQKALEGTQKAHQEGAVPIFIGTFDKVDAESIGHAIYYFELATAVFVYALGENPFDQPGVENYKKAMYQLLGKES